MNHHSGLRAVIWDFDGTLVDTRCKNLSVTRKIIADLTGHDGSRFPALRNLASYQVANRRAMNWRELYRREFGFNDEETDRAGRLWAPYQARDETPTPLFDGIAEVVRQLRGYAHGIVSQNARGSILATLESTGLDRHFQLVIGYEEVEISRQKPAPDGLLQCIEALTVAAPGPVLYIGDHPVDVRCAINANQALAEHGIDVQVITVGVFYGSPAGGTDWDVEPDHRVGDPRDILPIARALGV